MFIYTWCCTVWVLLYVCRQTAIAVLMVVIGFVTFYVVPYAFTYQQIPLFLSILTAILLGMLFGLCIIAASVQPHIEKLIVHILLSCYQRHLKPVVLKNLMGHRNRNSKTAQMFTICLGFLIFAGVMFALQERSLSDNVKVCNIPRSCIIITLYAFNGFHTPSYPVNFYVCTHFVRYLLVLIL